MLLAFLARWGITAKKTQRGLRIGLCSSGNIVLSEDGRRRCDLDVRGVYIPTLRKMFSLWAANLTPALRG